MSSIAELQGHLEVKAGSFDYHKDNLSDFEAYSNDLSNSAVDQSKAKTQRAQFDATVKSRDDMTTIVEQQSVTVPEQVVSSENARIIDTVRAYQQELFERAKEENVIAVLDTGSGKTLIACLLVRHILDIEAQRRIEGHESRAVFFLADNTSLVDQQQKVLSSNLTTAPLVFVGSEKRGVWKQKESWPGLLNRNTPIVCTPAILQQCLDLGAIRMEQIALLVFDEAHNAKKNHPYSAIMRLHYVHCRADRRPKIFGMTASPVDSNGKVDDKVLDLESLLHSKIVTTTDFSILDFAPKPEDVIWRFPRLRLSFETDLHQKLWAHCYFVEELRKGFEFSRSATSELGVWCANRVWKYVFAGHEYEGSNITRRYEQSKSYAELESVEERSNRLALLQTASELVKQDTYQFSEATTEFFSSKVLRLRDEIKARYESDKATRTIVFVNQRYTAYILRDCFLKFNIRNLRVDVMVGATATASSLKSHIQSIENFRSGLTNLIFATSVADEGIDIPQCNLCIRFDLYRTPIQYMQSRGRARLPRSTYVHFLEEDNYQQEQIMKFVIASDKYIRAVCQNLPSDRLLGGSTALQRLLARDSKSRVMKTKSGAICNFENSLMILSRFVASLKYRGALEKETYEEEIDMGKNEFTYVVRLPPNTETNIPGARGESKPNKQLAKRSAAWNCCYKLRGEGLLDDDFYSVFRKVKPSNLNSRLAVSGKKSAYEMMVKPSFWSKGLGSKPTELHAASISFTSVTQLVRPLANIIILSREMLPDIPSFSVYPENNVETKVSLKRIRGVFKVSQDEINDLTIFTLDGVFLDVFNKLYEKDAQAMGYWLAPMRQSSSSRLGKVCDLVDMEFVKATQKGRVRWSPEQEVAEIWSNKFICDPRDGRYHYFTDGAVPGTSIFDPVPDEVPTIPHKSRHNIIDFSDSTWRGSKKAWVAATWDPNQPVLAAEMITTRRNFLEKRTKKECQRIDCMIAPQPLEVSRLIPNFAASCLIWPVIIHRVEQYMIVLEALEKLELPEIPADLALEAFTKDENTSVDDTDQWHTSSNKQGMGKNYERFEFIGDSLLKMMTTITVYNLTRLDEEGMHCRRMEILCNRRLFEVSTEFHQLYRYVRTNAFNRTTWYPENLVLLKGRGAKKDPIPLQHSKVFQNLGMKTIADISEAIIGAAVMASRNTSQKFDLAIRAITTLVQSGDHCIHSWADIPLMCKLDPWATGTGDPIANQMARDIAARMGYRFKHPRLLRSAFTHSSEINATVPDLQRLEFLGDAVLDWVCISWLFETNPDRNPQWLTEHKMAMVSNKFLAALAVVLDFDKMIRLMAVKLSIDIANYARQVRAIWSAQDKSSIKRDFWTQMESPPKALSDLVESYLGAVLVDSNWNYDEIESFFSRHILWFFEDITQYDSFANRHPTSYLHKVFTDDFKCRKFNILASEPRSGIIEQQITADVMVHGNKLAQGTATSARYAKVKASKEALARVEGMTAEEFRFMYGCDCRVKGAVL